MYQPTNNADIDAAFFGAGCSADEDQVDFDDLLSRLAEGEGLLDLADAATGAVPAADASAGAVPATDASAGAAAGLTADAACADAADGDDSEVRHE